jgi:trehalose synthase
MSLLDDYARVTGEDVISHLRQLAAPLQGLRIVHVNSTRVGGGVAEILHKLVPLMRELGIAVDWEIIEGTPAFFQTTKSFHNALQGNRVELPRASLDTFEQVNATNAARLRPVLEAADVVFVHDPQPVPLLRHCSERRGKWIWRCHIDVSRPFRPVWKYLREYVCEYDASVFSLAEFSQFLPHPQYVIAPSIDPLSEKNIDLPSEEVQAVCDEFRLDRTRPLLVQISRFDRFKDPLGVIRGYKLAKKYIPALQLVLAGGGASDDPESEAVLQEVGAAANEDADIRVLVLPPDAHRKINALQRAADIVIQKSLREGFGLTVTEALWKGRAVIGGDTGGIRLQVVDHHTGFLVGTAEGMALRVRYLLRNREKLAEMGQKGRSFVRENFLLTRHLREYLTLVVGLTHAAEERIELT